MLLTTVRICADDDGELAIRTKMADPVVQQLVQKAVAEALEIVDGISGAFTVEIAGTASLSIDPFVVAPVIDEDSARDYIDELVAHDCAFDIGTDLKTLVPHPFTHDEALIVADRMESARDYIDVERYMEVASARKVWATEPDTKKHAAFFAFEAHNNDLSEGDMVVLLEWANPGSSYVDLDRGALVTLMEHSEVKPRQNGAPQ